MLAQDIPYQKIINILCSVYNIYIHDQLVKILHSKFLIDGEHFISMALVYIYIYIYRIMQIVRGGKVSRLADLSVIRWKTFAIVQQFETPHNKKDKNSL